MDELKQEFFTTAKFAIAYGLGYGYVSELADIVGITVPGVNGETQLYKILKQRIENAHIRFLEHRKKRHPEIVVPATEDYINSEI